MPYEIRWRGPDGTLRRGEMQTARAAIAEVVQLRHDGYRDIEVEDTETHIVYDRLSMADLFRQFERPTD
jgi:hypothetical protein